jgi:hypothetical protein
MKMNVSTHNPVPDPGWQILGDLDLPSGEIPGNAIQAWLMNVLAPLNLSQDFLNRVLQSAQESASRGLQQKDPTSNHIHLSILTPYEQTASQKTWGFFHTERSENQAGSDTGHVHWINYYLYVDGE